MSSEPPLPRLPSEPTLYKRQRLPCKNCGLDVERNDMLILPCSHALCEPCMQRNKGGDGRFMCPICKSEFLQRPPSQDSTASQFHNGGIMNPSQSSASSRDDEDNQALSCPKHHSKVQDYYCLTCDKLACPVCIKQEHLKHKTNFLSTVACQLKLTTSQVQEQVNTGLQASLQWSIEKAHNHRQALSRKHGKLKERVQAQVDMVKTFLEDQKRETLKNLERTAQTIDNKLAKHIHMMETQLKKVKEECRAMVVMQNAPDTRVLHSKQRQHEFFVSNPRDNLCAFLAYKKDSDFNVMTTSNPKDALPKKLKDALRQHIGTEISGFPTGPAHRPVKYALCDKIQYPKNPSVLKHLKAIKATLMGWKSVPAFR